MAKKPRPSEALGMVKSSSPAGRKRPSEHMTPGKMPGKMPGKGQPGKPSDGERSMH